MPAWLNEAPHTPQAQELLRDNPGAVFIDCRSEMEYLFVGQPHFVGQVSRIASMNRPVVLICRSGQRSVDAGHALEQAGFSDVVNVLEGFEGPLDATHERSKISGWRFHGLPWEQC